MQSKGTVITLCFLEYFDVFNTRDGRQIGQTGLEHGLILGCRQL